MAANHNPVYKSEGEAIRSQARDNEVVFMTSGYALPEVVIYAGRNIQSWEATGTAYALMREDGVHNGVRFFVGKDGSMRAVHFALQ